MATSKPQGSVVIESARTNKSVILALRLELVIAYQVSGDYSSASVTV